MNVIIGSTTKNEIQYLNVNFTAPKRLRAEVSGRAKISISESLFSDLNVFFRRIHFG